MRLTENSVKNLLTLSFHHTHHHNLGIARKAQAPLPLKRDAGNPFPHPVWAAYHPNIPGMRKLWYVRRPLVIKSGSFEAKPPPGKFSVSA